MLFLGCDPDMHTMPFAWVDENLKVQRIFILKAGGVEHSALLDMSRVAGRMQECSFEKVGAYAVEAQEIYPSGPDLLRQAWPSSLVGCWEVLAISLYPLNGKVR